MRQFTRTFLPFADTDSYGDLILDYLGDDVFLEKFMSFDDHPDGVFAAISNYQNPRLNRQLIKEIFKSQYKGLEPHERIVNNIEALSDAKTFTVTAGHQLNIFGGPLFVIYKLLTAINLCEKLSILFPSYRFVPVYWMVTEDHDIEEISTINLHGKNLKWQYEWQGLSGKMPLSKLEDIIHVMKDSFGNSEYAEGIFKQIENAYSTSSTLAEATRKWIDSLLGKYGLLILDPNVAALKEVVSDILVEEAVAQTSSPIINETTAMLEERYHSQAKPREINLFYLGNNSRSRLVNENGTVRALNTEFKFSRDELKKEVQVHPEKFSPNVVLRPLYQESILPNIVFTGGPAEIAYWLELKKLFEHHRVPMPVLFHRCSAMILDKNTMTKLDKLNISKKEIFNSADELIKQYIVHTEKNTPSVEQSVKLVNEEFSKLADSVQLIDPTLRSTIESENQKVTASLNNLRDKIIRALKKKNETEVNQIKKLKDKLFPSGKLQERNDSFLSYYLTLGEEFISMLKENLDPMQKEFIILSEEDKPSS